MTWWQVVLSVLLGLLVNEGCDISPWLARRLVRWSARRRYGNITRADVRAEELAALIDERPGKLFKLLTALGFAATAVAVGTRRRSRPLVGGVGDGVVRLLAGVAAVVRLPRRRNPLLVLHDMTSALSHADGTTVDILLDRVLRLVPGHWATLWVPAQGRYPEVLLSARVDYHGLIDSVYTPDSLRLRAMETASTVVARRGDRALQAELANWDGRDVIVVPLRSGHAVIGTLEIARPIRRRHFGTKDVLLMEMATAHAAVAVENSRLVDRLRFDAYHDPLTGLANRRRTREALAEATRVTTPGEVLALLLLDVAGMRGINNTLSHAVGDKVLAEVGHRLWAAAPSAALVARTGGDEFAVVVRTGTAADAVMLADEIRGTICGPMSVGTHTLAVDCVVGVVVHPDHGDKPDTLLRLVDIAAHAAKADNMPVRLYDSSLLTRIRTGSVAAE
jgi:diguanylate cyclase (GGDEF)-like protein